MKHLKDDDFCLLRFFGGRDNDGMNIAFHPSFERYEERANYRRTAKLLKAGLIERLARRGYYRLTETGLKAIDAENKSSSRDDFS